MNSCQAVILVAFIGFLATIFEGYSTLNRYKQKDYPKVIMHEINPIEIHYPFRDLRENDIVAVILTDCFYVAYVHEMQRMGWQSFDRGVEIIQIYKSEYKIVLYLVDDQRMSYALGRFLRTDQSLDANELTWKDLTFKCWHCLGSITWLEEYQNTRETCTDTWKVKRVELLYRPTVPLDKVTDNVHQKLKEYKPTY
jgi:hypothetical protein